MTSHRSGSRSATDARKLQKPSHLGARLGGHAPFAPRSVFFRLLALRAVGHTPRRRVWFALGDAPGEAAVTAAVIVHGGVGAGLRQVARLGVLTGGAGRHLGTLAQLWFAGASGLGVGLPGGHHARRSVWIVGDIPDRAARVAPVVVHHQRRLADHVERAQCRVLTQGAWTRRHVGTDIARGESKAHAGIACEQT